MSLNHAPSIVTDGLVLYFDAANNVCFKGEPTTNLMLLESDYTGTAYAPSTEWAGSVLRKTYDSNIITPIGTGATLIMESGGTGFHTLSRMGGGETGNFCISAYIKPVTADVTGVRVGMLSSWSITFNLTTRQITYNLAAGAPRSAFIEDVYGYPGWLRVGGNIWGRSGGWVGAIGYDMFSYTGTNNAKQMYITGLQYETGVFAPTRYLRANTTRGKTVPESGGLFDLSRNSNHGKFTASGISILEPNQKFVYLNGSGNQYIDTTSSLNAVSIFAFVRPKSSDEGVIYGPLANGADNWLSINNYKLYFFGTESTNVNNFAVTGVSTLSSGVWYHVGCTINGDTVKLYLNGQEEISTTKAFTIAPWDSLAAIGRRGSTSQRYFNGDISILQVYDKILTPAEIQRNFNATRGRFGI